MKESPFNLTEKDSVNATVIAINQVGNSTVSSVGSGAIIIGVPGAPINLVENQDETTGTQAAFTWSAPSDDGGSPILDYSVEQFYTASGSFSLVASGLTSTSYSLGGLSENTSYKFRIKARNEVGFGDYSSEFSMDTDLVNIGTITGNGTYWDSVTINGNEIIKDSGTGSRTLTVDDINSLL